MRELIITNKIDEYGDNILSNEVIYYKDDKAVRFRTDKVDGELKLYTIKEGSGEGTVVVPYNFEEGNNNYNNY